MTVESPCILICSIHADTGWCHGCGRSVTEIMDWASGEPDWRAQVTSELPDRLAQIPKRERRTTRRRASRDA